MSQEAYHIITGRTIEKLEQVPWPRVVLQESVLFLECFPFLDLSGPVLRYCEFIVSAIPFILSVSWAAQSKFP